MNPAGESDLDLILRTRMTTEAKTIEDDRTLGLLVFSYGGTWYAFPGESVKEIVPQTTVFPVPGCPESIEGVINVRGDIESVVSLASFLGAGTGSNSHGWSILIGQAGGFQSGVRVDAVVDVVEVLVGSVMPPHSALPDRLKPLVTGLAPYQGATVPVLDLGRIFRSLLEETL